MSSDSEFISRLEHALRWADFDIVCTQSHPSTNTSTFLQSVIESCVWDKGVCAGTNLVFVFSPGGYFQEKSCLPFS